MSFQKLRVYQRAQAMFPEIYREVRSWPEKDQRELGSQLIRAANSVHSNIAEGYGKSWKDFARYLGQSLTSCDEVKSHSTDARNVGLLAEERYQYFLGEYVAIGKQLYRLREQVRVNR